VAAITTGTTGYCGGDSGHGGRTYFKIDNLASTDLMARIDEQGDFIEVPSIELRLGGDSELRTFIEALEFALKVLKSQVTRQT